jgi:hypothetical protein
LNTDFFHQLKQLPKVGMSEMIFTKLLMVVLKNEGALNHKKFALNQAQFVKKV